MDWNSVKLSRTEREVLKYFEANRGKALTRTQIVAAVWNQDYLGLTNIVDVNVHAIREKLGRDVILTVRGVGYIMPNSSEFYKFMHSKDLACGPTAN